MKSSSIRYPFDVFHIFLTTGARIADSWEKSRVEDVIAKKPAPRVVVSINLRREFFDFSMLETSLFLLNH